MMILVAVGALVGFVSSLYCWHAARDPVSAEPKRRAWLWVVLAIAFAVKLIVVMGFLANAGNAAPLMHRMAGGWGGRIAGALALAVAGLALWRAIAIGRVNTQITRATRRHGSESLGRRLIHHLRCWAWVCLLVMVQGCGHAHYEGFDYWTVIKDVSGEATIIKPDGTSITVKVSSNVNADVVKAATEGAVGAAVKAVKP